jgi:hypothetical protein
MKELIITFTLSTRLRYSMDRYGKEEANQTKEGYC